MTIDRNLVTYDFHCDGCSVGAACFDADTTQEAVSKAKEAGWKVRKLDDEWHHFCPDCGSDL